MNTLPFRFIGQPFLIEARQTCASVYNLLKQRLKKQHCCSGPIL